MEIRNSKKHSVDFHNFILGQSPFPVFEGLKEGLSQSVKKSFYAPYDGVNELKTAIQSFYEYYLNLKIHEDRILLGYGTKHIMSLLFEMLEGHFILPVPAWVGYEPLLKMKEKEYSKIILKHEEAYKISPYLLDEVLSQINDQTILILNNPHNPTGAIYSEKELLALKEVLLKYQTIVISDEIYALLTFNKTDFASMSEVYPERTFMTNGVSKDRSAAGYRLGVCVFPSEHTQLLKNTYHKIIANTFTNISTPIQYAAIKGYTPSKELTDYLRITNSIHSLAAESIYEAAIKIPQAIVSKPYGGFYLTINLNAYKTLFINNHIYKVSNLTERLLESPYYVACVGGDSIGLSEDDFTLRIAFIDYDGAQLFEMIKNNRDASKDLVKPYFNHMENGIKNIQRFLRDLS